MIFRCPDEKSSRSATGAPGPQPQGPRPAELRSSPCGGLGVSRTPGGGQHANPPPQAPPSSGGEDSGRDCHKLAKRTNNRAPGLMRFALAAYPRFVRVIFTLVILTCASQVTATATIAIASTVDASNQTHTHASLTYICERAAYELTSDLQQEAAQQLPMLSTPGGVDIPGDRHADAFVHSRERGCQSSFVQAVVAVPSHHQHLYGVRFSTPAQRSARRYLLHHSCALTVSKSTRQAPCSLHRTGLRADMGSCYWASHMRTRGPQAPGEEVLIDHGGDK